MHRLAAEPRSSASAADGCGCTEHLACAGRAEGAAINADKRNSTNEHSSSVTCQSRTGKTKPRVAWDLHCGLAPIGLGVSLGHRLYHAGTEACASALISACMHLGQKLAQPG